MGSFDYLPHHNLPTRHLPSGHLAPGIGDVCTYGHSTRINVTLPFSLTARQISPTAVPGWRPDGESRRHRLAMCLRKPLVPVTPRLVDPARPPHRTQHPRTHQLYQGTTNPQVRVTGVKHSAPPFASPTPKASRPFLVLDGKKEIAMSRALVA